MKALTLLLGLLLLSPAWAQPNFEAAAKALEQGHDGEALGTFQRLDAAGSGSFGSYYNEGLALRNLGDIPRARASFERALLLDPHDLATRRRLREIDSRLGDKVTSLDVLGTPWWKLHEAEFLLLLPGLGMLLLGVTARLKKRPLAATPTLVLWLGGVGLIAVIGLTSPARERAVVVDKSAQLLPEAEPDKPGETLPAGVLVEVLERDGHYTKIRLRNGKSGWLRNAQLVELSLPQQAKAKVASPAAKATATLNS